MPKVCRPTPTGPRRAGPAPLPPAALSSLPQREEPMRCWKHPIPGTPATAQTPPPASLTATLPPLPAHVRLLELTAEQNQLLSDLLEATRQLNATLLARSAP